LAYGSTFSVFAIIFSSVFCGSTFIIGALVVISVPGCGASRERKKTGGFRLPLISPRVAGGLWGGWWFQIDVGGGVFRRGMAGLLTSSIKVPAPFLSFSRTYAALAVDL